MFEYNYQLLLLMIDPYKQQDNKMEKNEHKYFMWKTLKERKITSKEKKKLT